MARYISSFVIPVPKKNLAKYRKMAQRTAKVFHEHGAVSYVECVGDDVKPGKVTSFPQSVKLKKGEVVVFGWVEYKSRKHHDQVMAKVMNDPRFADMMEPENMPFDGMRSFWGGFKPLVEA
jgi:uncharacterized protein YbaA (DUF1428 family)